MELRQALRRQAEEVTPNAEQYNNNTYRPREFTGRETLSIHEITKKFVNEWIVWIQEQPAPDKRKIGIRAPSLYPAMIKALHNRAKDAYNDEDMGIIRIPFSPFKKADIPKYKAPRKRAITAEDIRKIATLPYEKESTRASRLRRYSFVLEPCYE
jgi:hypothetical protein